MDIFEMFFGGGRRRGRRERKGQNVIHQLSVSLEELYKGTVRKLALQKNVICDKCEGKHFEKSKKLLLDKLFFKFCTNFDFVLGVGGKKGAVEQCTNCNGTGMQVQVEQLGPGMLQRLQSMCTECQGQGERINSKDRCKQCNGRKTIRDRKILEVHVDKGMVDGQKIIFSGEGDQEPGLEPGDIVILLDEKEHEVFK